MNSVFFDCVNKCLKKHFDLDNIKVDLEQSILIDLYQDQIVVVELEFLIIGIVLEKEQVQFLVASTNLKEWFDLSSITYYLSECRDDWVFENFQHPITPQDIENRVGDLILIFLKYKEQIVQFFKDNNELELKRLMLKRWGERKKRLKQKMRFPFS